MESVNELLDLIILKETGKDTYVGHSIDIGSRFVFGGQVLGQALNAAQRSVPEDRFVHSLHSYFILPGDKNTELNFEVDRMRDGRSFTTRRVKASQKGEVIFIMAASFHKVEEGYHHQDLMPDVQGPEGLKNWEELISKFVFLLPQKAKRFAQMNRPIEFRPIDPVNPMLPSKGSNRSYIWFRFKDPSVTDPHILSQLLAYASDYNLLVTAIQPHKKATLTNTQMASLDHAMWFHDTFDPTEWILYEIESPSAGGARGFVNAKLYTQTGKLIASASQEGLIRPI